MAKWADYCISAVRYNSTGAHIEKVEVRVDNGDTIGTPTEASKNDVVTSIESGKTFVTITKNGTSWNEGEDVRVINVNNNKYLRTDRDNTPADNLGSLPRF